MVICSKGAGGGGDPVLASGSGGRGLGGGIAGGAGLGVGGGLGGGLLNVSAAGAGGGLPSGTAEGGGRFDPTTMVRGGPDPGIASGGKFVTAGGVLGDGGTIGRGEKGGYPAVRPVLQVKQHDNFSLSYMVYLHPPSPFAHNVC